MKKVYIKPAQVVHVLVVQDHILTVSKMKVDLGDPEVNDDLIKDQVIVPGEDNDQTI